MAGLNYTFYRKYGKNILLRYRKNGKTYSKKIDFYKPSLYIPIDGNEEPASVDIYGNPLKQIQFDGLKEATSFANMVKDSGQELHGNRNFANQFVIELNDGQMPEFNPSEIRAGFLDIEVHAEEMPKPEEAKWPISGITIYDNFTDTFYTIGLPGYIHDHQSKDVGHLTVEYIECVDEVAILEKIVEHFGLFQYDITTGWNSEMFDMPYIVNRIENILGESYVKRLSPFGVVNKRTVRGNFGDERLVVDIVGMPHLDYLALYQKHIFTPRESYKLDFIANAELGEAKMTYEEEGSLYNLFTMNYQKYMEYNIKDVDLVKRLNDKLGLLELTYTLAYYTLSNFEDTLGTTRIWEQLVAKHLYSKGVAPLFNGNGSWREYEGAYVKPPMPGMHEWVISYDLNSLYPHIEMQVNIGPETWVAPERLPDEVKRIRSQVTVEKLLNKEIDLSPLKKYDLSMAANGECYIRSKKSFFSEIKNDLYKKRKEYKKEMISYKKQKEAIKASEDKSALNEIEQKIAFYDNLQMGMKILLNAGYGALGNEHFLYFKVENAEAITVTGQVVNQWTCSRLQDYLTKVFKEEHNYWTYGDTDSVEGSSIINVNGKDITIADYYDGCPELFTKRDVDDENYVKSTKGLGHLTPSVSKDGVLRYNAISYVMKHKVKKRMFRIEVGGNTVTVTQDHSIMVKRDGSIVECKPHEIQEGDVLITIE
jgi:DNA polymerase elongation subunit (family B)